MSSPAWLGEALTHYITITVLQKTLSASVIGFTSPDSLLRPGLLAVQLMLASLVCRSAALDGINSNIRVCVMAGIFMEPIVFLDQAVLSRWTFEARGPTSFFPSKKTSTGSRKTAVGRVQKDDISLGSDSAWMRYLFGLATSTNWRLLNTPWEVNGCPQFSAADKAYVPSRPRFLVKATAVFLACYYFMDFLIVAGGQNPPNISAFMPDKVPVFTGLGEITAEEVITRLAASIMHFVGTYCVVQSFYYATAVPCVALGSQVRDWRPAFGSLSELYTVRKFWG